MKNLFLFFAIALSFNTSGQIISSNRVLPEPVVLAYEYYYYGLDMSLSTITYPDKVNSGAEFREKYGQLFVDEYAKFVPFKTLTKWLQKGRVFYHPYEVQQLWRKIPDNWINEEYVPITQEQIQDHVRLYDFTAKEGLGFVVIAANFNKKTAKSLAYFVFFDIKTRDLLWIAEIKGSCIGSGIPVQWVAGLEHATRLFVDKEYKIAASKIKK